MRRIIGLKYLKARIKDDVVKKIAHWSENQDSEKYPDLKKYYTKRGISNPFLQSLFADMVADGVFFSRDGTNKDSIFADNYIPSLTNKGCSFVNDEGGYRRKYLKDMSNTAWASIASLALLFEIFMSVRQGAAIDNLQQSQADNEATHEAIIKTLERLDTKLDSTIYLLQNHTHDNNGRTVNK